MPRLCRDDKSERSFVLWPRLEGRLDQLDIAKAGQALTRSADHFGPGVDCNDLQIACREALCCLPRAAADFENRIAGLQAGVRNHIVDESFGLIRA